MTKKTIREGDCVIDFDVKEHNNGVRGRVRFTGNCKKVFGDKIKNIENIG